MNAMQSDKIEIHHSRSVVPRELVCVSKEAERVGAPSDEHEPEPIVELVKEGDTVLAIDVTCVCGHHIRLRCEYGSPAN